MAFVNEKVSDPRPELLKNFDEVFVLSERCDVEVDQRKSRDLSFAVNDALKQLLVIFQIFDVGFHKLAATSEVNDADQSKSFAFFLVLVPLVTVDESSAFESDFEAFKTAADVIKLPAGLA